MSDWMPSTNQVRADFGELAEGTSERRLAGFDRWLAALIREAKAEAWGEGYKHAYTVGVQEGLTGKVFEYDAPNPYREGSET